MKLSSRILVIFLATYGSIMGSCDVIKKSTKPEIGSSNSYYPRELECGFSIPIYRSNDKAGLAKIINGRAAYPGEFPHQVYLKIKRNGGKEFTCGGVLISEQLILTAAHCLVNPKSTSGSQYIKASKIKAILGDHSTESFDETETLIGIEEIFVHENYDQYSVENDIALLLTSEPLTFRLDVDIGYGSINRVCLPKKRNIRYSPEELMIVSGWGMTTNETSSDKTLYRPHTLQMARQEVWNEADCRKVKLETKKVNAKRDVCASDKSDKHMRACYGDSGGPLIRFLDDGRYELVGIVSAGSNNCKLDAPTIYTKVSYYLDWIVDKKLNISKRRNNKY